MDKEDKSYLPYSNREEFKDFAIIEYINFNMYGTNREGNEEDIAYRLSKLNIHEGSIIISHVPPHKCLDKGNNGVYYGSKAIRDMIKEKKPRIFFCGHVHEDFSFKKLYNTLVFNAACDDEITRGWVVDLETAKYEMINLT